MIISIGIDVVDVPRFQRLAQKFPMLLDRVFTPEERWTDIRRLAAYFAAKEAIAKALRGTPGMSWHDCSIANTSAGVFTMSHQGTVEAAAERLGINAWNLAVSLRDNIAMATVIAENRPLNDYGTDTSLSQFRCLR